jgi:hypothetical protein
VLLHDKGRQRKKSAPLSVHYVGLVIVALPDYVRPSRRESHETVAPRQNKRYQLSADVTFSWEGADGRKNYGEGHTRDISPIGVFVVTHDRLPLGTTVELEIVLPSLHERRSSVKLETHGKVIRAEEKGFAAIGDFMIQLPKPGPQSTRSAGLKETAASTRRAERIRPPKAT